MSSWKKMFERFHDELISKSITDEEWEREFDVGFGKIEGTAFVAFSEYYVYFPVQYDSSEWMTRMPLNSDIEFQPFHVG